MNFKIKPLVWENDQAGSTIAYYYVHKENRAFVACGYGKVGFLLWHGPARRSESKAQADAEKHHAAQAAKLINNLIEVTP